MDNFKRIILPFPHAVWRSRHIGGPFSAAFKRYKGITVTAWMGEVKD